jgi:hypothetical protein
LPILLHKLNIWIKWPKNVGCVSKFHVTAQNKQSLYLVTLLKPIKPWVGVWTIRLSTDIKMAFGSAALFYSSPSQNSPVECNFMFSKIHTLQICFVWQMRTWPDLTGPWFECYFTCLVTSVDWDMAKFNWAVVNFGS